jgi:gliding motility-associated-like protein
MKRLFAFALGCCFFVLSGAQNLVPNWSFEDTIQCPDNLAQLNRTQYWFNPTTGSPDYFNSCDTRPLYMNVPYAAPGYQNAHTGNAYAGCYYGGPSLVPANCREYIEVQLTDSLISGNSYCISFYVSLANMCSMAITNVGCYLSQAPITSSNTFQLPVTPQLENQAGNYLSDTMNWMKISGIYIASGGEKYFTLGNFHDDATTDSIRIDQRGAGVYYYYIDDVSVILCPDTLITEDSNNFYIPNAFSPNNDGNNDILFVRGRNIDQLSFTVYDRWGQRVFETHDINEGWDGTYRGEEMENAVFVYYLTLTYSDGKTEVKKGNVSLVR